MKKLVMLVVLGLAGLVHSAHDSDSDSDSVVAENAKIAERRNKLALAGSKNSCHQFRRNKQAANACAQLVCNIKDYFADQQKHDLCELARSDTNSNSSIASSSSSLKSPNSSFDRCKSCPN